ncbi:TonB-dependent receptor [Marilutibacter aestuarii]|uniref:TonB-dependent receptor n=1 Tax=Marilutibacter aestuarii TaxID=1706195 RepID=A0A508APS4_9GAMM|nr:TonB-dependent receptor [Lysobacter aestuarii]TQD51739.1 TonB-dependent receptor [Lysobacter aestuarii]
MQRGSAPYRFRPVPLAAAIAGALCLSALAPAWAQEAGGAAPDEARVPAEGSVDATATDLDVVLVTAQKRSENLREVPLSISVLSEQQLEDSHSVQITDFAGYMPGMQVTPSGTPGQTSISLRGIGTQADNATIGIYIDDVPVGSSSLYGRSALFNADLLAYDTARIEVLRGPQGTLYGASTLGGLLKYVTHGPDASEFSSRVGAGVYGIDGGTGWSARASINAPLVEDRLALTASYSVNNSPGYTNDVGKGANRVNDFEQAGGRFALGWNLTEDVSLEVSALKQSTDADNPAVVALDPTTLEPLFGELDGFQRVDQPFAMDVDLYAATLDWNVGWADFTSVTSYSTIDTHQVNDNSVQFGDLNLLFGVPAGDSRFDLRLNLEKWTQEFRLASKSDERFEWMVGTFHTREDSENSQIVTQLTYDGDPIAALDGFFVAGLPSTYEENAIFANATWKFTQRFDASAGVRFARNEQDFSQVASGLLADLLGASGDFPGSSSEDVTTWSLSSRYRLSDSAMAYGRIATGYRPGGPNVVLPGVPPSVGADTIKNYELGIKADLFDRRVYVDAGLFRMNWDNIQVGLSTPDGSANYYGNAAEATSQGAEWSIVFTPTADLRLGVTGAYTDAEFTQSVPQIDVEAGDPLPGVAQWSGAFTADYSRDINAEWVAHVGGGWRWTDAQAGGIVGNPSNKPYSQVDLNASVTNQRWTARVYVRNLTDELVYLNPGQVQNALTGEVPQYNAVPLQPRTVGIEVDYRF